MNRGDYLLHDAECSTLADMLKDEQHLRHRIVIWYSGQPITG